MKTTVRATVILPDAYVTIQRLYDYGTFYQLDKQTLMGHRAAEFIETLKAQGGKLIDRHEFTNDDMTVKICATFEYIA